MISSLQLAKRCGVSQGTVDRALHGRPGISDVTRKLVLAMAERHGYKPHPAARELLHGDRSVVGAVIPASGGVFFMDLMSELHRVLADAGLRLVLCYAGDDAALMAAVDDFAARRCLGVIVVPPHGKMSLPLSVTGGLPVISLLNPCQGPGVHWVGPDEEATGRQAVEYLWKRGHRRILHYTYDRESRPIRDREAGYGAALRKHGGAVVTVVEGRDNLVQRVAREKATALFCHNDWLALTAMRLLGEAGQRVPRDVSVLGVDNSPTFTGLCGVITTLSYPMAAVAQACAGILRGGKVQAGSIGRFTLVERETVASPPGD